MDFMWEIGYRDYNHMKEIVMADWEEVDVDLGSLKCKWCNREIETPVGKEFCSRSCFSKKVMTGRRMSEETKAKMKKSHIGLKRSDETNVKIRMAQIGSKRSEETKAKMRAAIVRRRDSGNLSHNHTEEARRKMSESQKKRWDSLTPEDRAIKTGFGSDNPFYGRIHTKEAKERMAKAKLGKTLSPEHKLKISTAITGERNPNYGKNLSGEKSSRYGKTHTEEVRRIISEKVSGKNHRLYGKNHSEESIKKMRENSYWRGKKRPDISESMRMRHNNPDFRKKMISSGYSNNGIYVSSKAGEVRYRSSWEKTIFESLDSDPLIREYAVEPFGIEYTYDNRIRTYYPDLLIKYTDGSRVLVEIKPKDMVQYPIVRAKLKAACAYCKNNGIKFKVWHKDNCQYLRSTIGG